MPPLDKLRVVIVDTEPTFLKMWERVFKTMDDCAYCITNDESVAMTLVHEGRVDLLISEAVMEKMSGFDLANELHRVNQAADIIITTAYTCDLSRFNLEDPKFHILYKPYRSMNDVIKFVSDILQHKDPRHDMDEDSWSENETFPAIMEWKL
jgi:DNA-binding NtrC family response regulator